MSKENKYGVILLPFIAKQAATDNTVVNKVFKILKLCPMCIAYVLPSSEIIYNIL